MPAGDNVFIADDNTPAVKPVGAVVIVHGMGGTALELANYAEALAERGYAVVIPHLDDSIANNLKVNPAIGGVRNRITRCWHVQCCIEWLHARYGADLSIGLLGHSLGTDTIARIRGNYPKIFLAGPHAMVGPHAFLAKLGIAWLENGVDTHQWPGASTEPPALIVGSHTDDVAVPPAVMVVNAGRPNALPLTIEHCTSGRLPKAATYAFPELGHDGYCDPRLSGDASAARLLVPLVVKFCQQWVGSATKRRT